LSFGLESPINGSKFQRLHSTVNVNVTYLYDCRSEEVEQILIERRS